MGVVESFLYIHGGRQHESFRFCDVLNIVVYILRLMGVIQTALDPDQHHAPEMLVWSHPFTTSG